MATSAPRSSGSDPRIPWVDYAKGICICFVVMMHSTLGVGEAAGGRGFMHHVVEFALPFRMPDFFLISGLFLSLVIGRDWRLYLDRKVVHFAYFYVLWLLIQGVFKWPGLALEQGPLAVVEAFLVALVQPFGTLWFIYLLPVFFVAAKLLKNVPPVLVLTVAAALETARIATGSVVVDETAMRFFYFCVGWYAAPYIFALARIAADRAGATLVVLLAWAVLNAVAVTLDIAILPGVSLVLGLMGCSAVIATAALLARFKFAEPLRYAGEHSIVIYLAFFLPMAATRTLLLKTGIVTDIGWMSLIVTIVAIISPVILYLIVQRTGYGRFLFERPATFRIDRKKPALQPAE
jgi:uncharacterized membrane protein YcfT